VGGLTPGEPRVAREQQHVEGQITVGVDGPDVHARRRDGDPGLGTSHRDPTRVLLMTVVVVTVVVVTIVVMTIVVITSS